jgi:hypothetical protein
MIDSAQSLDDLKVDLGGSYGLTDAMLYRYLTRAKNDLEINTNISFQASVPIITAANDKTFDLTNTAIIQTPTDCTIRSVKRPMYWFGQIPNKVGMIEIARRRQFTPMSGWPAMYCVHRPLAVLTFELWPSVMHVCPTFTTTNKLRLDVKWKHPDMDDGVTLELPDYCDCYLHYSAAFHIMGQNNDSRALFFKKLMDEEFDHIVATSITDNSGTFKQDWL